VSNERPQWESNLAIMLRCRERPESALSRSSIATSLASGFAPFASFETTPLNRAVGWTRDVPDLLSV